MILLLMIWTLWNFGCVAVNAVLYSQTAEPWSLGAVIFCGLMGVVSTGLLIKAWR
jgi:hypothetical protein